MLVKLFCEKYKLSTGSIYVSVSNGVIPKSVFFRPFNSAYDHINESYFVRRKEFRRKVNLYNQDVYYYLIDFFSVQDIANVLFKLYGTPTTATRPLINERLFAVDRSSILSARVTMTEWALFKYGRLLERELSQRAGKKVTISKILDRRAGI